MSLQANLAARFNIKQALCLNKCFLGKPFCLYLTLSVFAFPRHIDLEGKSVLFISEKSNVNKSCKQHSFHSSMCHILQALHLHFLVGMGNTAKKRSWFVTKDNDPRSYNSSFEMILCCFFQEYFASYWAVKTSKKLSCLLRTRKQSERRNKWEAIEQINTSEQRYKCKQCFLGKTYWIK